MSCPYWVDENVAGCSLPCPENIRQVVKGFTHVVSLVEEDEFYTCWSKGVTEFRRVLAELGVEHLWLPVPDMGAPDVDEACSLLDKVVEIVKKGGRILFHCYAGLGRTGTMLTAYLVRAKCMDWHKALTIVRRANPHAGPQSYVQELFLDYFESTCGCRKS